MIRRVFVVASMLVVIALASSPLWAQGNSEQQSPIFTYVAQWDVPRAQWADMVKVDAADKPLMDSLVADGTVIAYGSFENRIHSENGMTHGSWFTASSLGNIFKALDKIYAQPGSTTSPVQAASKHMDYLMISTTYGGKTFTNTTGYRRVVSAQLKPGREREFLDTYRRYVQPVYAKLLADGDILAYQLDAEYNIENAPGRFFSAVITRDAESLDKARVALNEVYEKNPAITAALVSCIEPNSRNDFLARVTNMSHK